MRRVLQLGDRYEMKHIRYESMDVEQIFHGDVLFQIHVVFRNKILRNEEYEGIQVLF